MMLVGYSDSESSGDEQQTIKTKTVSHKISATNPGFQKVDRSNPHKIRVNLPAVSHSSLEEDVDDGPPAKKPRLGEGGSFGALLPPPKNGSSGKGLRPAEESKANASLNALLPPPKNTGRMNGGIPSGAPKRGLGPGVSLRTGAAPAFSREPVYLEAQGLQRDEEEDSTFQHNGDGSTNTPSTNSEIMAGAVEPPKPKGSAMMFKPLSVARKPVKKKMSGTIVAAAPKLSTDSASQIPPKARPKISLFSSETSETPDAAPEPSTSEYKALVYEPLAADKPDVAETATTSRLPNESSMQGPSLAGGAHAKSLASIASDLNLSASDRRQLFGRCGSDASAVNNVLHFDTDAQYVENEKARQAGEQTLTTTTHKAVRAIAPGKHSLRQLVSAVSSQREALEEQFAQGKSNRKEGGARYGW